MGMQKRVWLLGYRHPSIKLYKTKPSKRKIMMGMGLASMSFILPDLSFGLILSTLVLSPIGFKNAFRNKLDDFNYCIQSHYYKWKS